MHPIIRKTNVGFELDQTIFSPYPMTKRKKWSSHTKLCAGVHLCLCAIHPKYQLTENLCLVSCQTEINGHAKHLTTIMPLYANIHKYTYIHTCTFTCTPTHTLGKTNTNYRQIHTIACKQTQSDRHTDTHMPTQRHTLGST